MITTKAILGVVLATASTILAADVASSGGDAGVVNLGGLFEKLGIVGVLSVAIIYLQRRNEASEKRSQDFAERALSTLSETTECMGSITEALMAMKCAITTETEEVREMRRALQESGRIMAQQGK